HRPGAGGDTRVDVARHPAQAVEPFQRLGDFFLLEAGRRQLAAELVGFRAGVSVDVAFEQVYEDVEQNGLLSIRLESTVDGTLRCPGLQGLRLALGRRNARLRVLPAGRSAKGDAAGSGALETAARQTREVSVQLEWQQDGVEGIDRHAAASGQRVDLHRVV